MNKTNKVPKPLIERLGAYDKTYILLLNIKF